MNTGTEAVEKQDIGKPIASEVKSRKGFQIAEPRIAPRLYGTVEAERLGLFASSIRSEERERANLGRVLV